MISTDNDTTTCDTKYPLSELSTPQQITVQLNDKITINCSFNFYAGSLCQVIPIWYDIVRNKEILAWDSDDNIGMNKDHVWLSFRGTSQFENGTSFNLSIAFDCNTLRNKSAKVPRYAENLPVFKTGITTPIFYFGNLWIIFVIGIP